MSKIAVLYGTTEGQTAKIAKHITARAQERGHEVHLRHIAELADDFDLRAYDAVIVGASIHEGHHQRYVVRFLKDNRDALAKVPTAAFTVCLAINSPNAKERDEAQSYAQQLEEQSGVHFGTTAVFAGALKYTEYSWLKRALMRQISKKEGGATDTSQDYEYTDYAQVDSFTDAFLERRASLSSAHAVHA